MCKAILRNIKKAFYIVLWTLGCAWPGGLWAQQGAGAPSGMDLTQLLQSSLTAHALAVSAQEWRGSALYPKSWLHFYAPHELCAALQQLSWVDFNVFFPILEQSTGLHGGGCLEQLLKAHVNRVPIGHKHQESVLAPSQALPIDEADFSYVSGYDLPPGEVVLSFDDGPHPYITPRVLEVLARHNVRAHFFVIGERAARYQNITSQIHKKHVLGSHTWSHPNLTRMGLKQAKHEICKGIEPLVTAVGRARPFFRFPYGAFSADLRSVVWSIGAQNMFWNIDSLDWKIKNPEDLFEHIWSQVVTQNRGIILLHDIHPQSLAVLPRLLEKLAAHNFKTRFYQNMWPDFSALPTGC